MCGTRTAARIRRESTLRVNASTGKVRRREYSFVTPGGATCANISMTIQMLLGCYCRQTEIEERLNSFFFSEIDAIDEGLMKALYARAMKESIRRISVSTSFSTGCVAFRGLTDDFKRAHEWLQFERSERVLLQRHYRYRRAFFLQSANC
jgi:hypothetical protein